MEFVTLILPIRKLTTFRYREIVREVAELAHSLMEAYGAPKRALLTLALHSFLGARDLH